MSTNKRGRPRINAISDAMMRIMVRGNRRREYTFTQMRCSECKDMKDHNEFDRISKTNPHLRSMCRECNTKKATAYVKNRIRDRGLKFPEDRSIYATEIISVLQSADKPLRVTEIHAIAKERGMELGNRKQDRIIRDIIQRDDRIVKVRPCEFALAESARKLAPVDRTKQTALDIEETLRIHGNPMTKAEIIQYMVDNGMELSKYAAKPRMIESVYYRARKIANVRKYPGHRIELNPHE